MIWLPTPQFALASSILKDNLGFAKNGTIFVFGSRSLKLGEYSWTGTTQVVVDPLLNTSYQQLIFNTISTNTGQIRSLLRRG